MPLKLLHSSLKKGTYFCLILALALVAALPVTVIADETCMSPYMAKIVGQEDYVYVWTLGAEGVGDEQDKLVTVDVNPASPGYGKVANSLSVGGRNEAHHSGFTDDRHYLWAGGLDTSKIFIFDVHTDPAKPTLYKTIDNFVEEQRWRGWPPHHLCPARANDADRPFQRQGPRWPHGAGRIHQHR